jgi:hypothetical protein
VRGVPADKTTMTALRIVVNRKVDEPTKSLYFHTDNRSPDEAAHEKRTKDTGQLSVTVAA